MKKFLIVLGVLAALALAIVILVFFLTSGVTKTADLFFQAVRDGDMETASTFLSEDFKAATSREELEGFLRGTALANYSSATWSSREVSGNTGKVEGSVKTAEGGAIPVQIQFVKEKGKWKIQRIDKAPSGLTEEPEADKTIPELEVLRRMTDTALRHFAEAVNRADFSDFHGTLSELWKNQITPEKLLEVFHTFVDQKIDLTVLSQFQPVFSEPPAVNEEGFLELTGYYPTQPSILYFTLNYTYEYPDWMLAGVHINLK
jgi:hypothetical protein